MATTSSSAAADPANITQALAKGARLKGVTIVEGVLSTEMATAITLLLLVGDGPEAPALQRLSGELGIGDEDLREDKHLSEITALIDPRQFDLISKPTSGLVVIQGGAGSGKTTIGLHRLAYLAFQDPQRFRSDQMLVIVFNDALVRYISRVLPALGVNDVPVMTFSDWAEQQRRRQPGATTAEGQRQGAEHPDRKGGRADAAAGERGGEGHLQGPPDLRHPAAAHHQRRAGGRRRACRCGR